MTAFCLDRRGPGTAAAVRECRPRSPDRSCPTRRFIRTLGWEAASTRSNRPCCARPRQRTREPPPVLLTAGHATFVTGRILMEAPGATVEVMRVSRRGRSGGRVAGRQGDGGAGALRGSGAERFVRMSYRGRPTAARPVELPLTGCPRTSWLLPPPAISVGPPPRPVPQRPRSGERRGRLPSTTSSPWALSTRRESARRSRRTAPWVDVYVPGRAPREYVSRRLVPVISGDDSGPDGDADRIRRLERYVVLGGLRERSRRSGHHPW